MARRKPNYIWTVQSNWAYMDDEGDEPRFGSEVYLFETKESAQQTFNALVSRDKHIHYAAEYREGEPCFRGYAWVEDPDGYWYIYQMGRHVENHSEIKMILAKVEDARSGL